MRALVQQKFKKELKQNKKTQHGGLGPLALAALPVAGALAGEIVKYIYHYVKKKVFGGKMKINHKSKNEQQDFLIQVLKKV